LMEKKQPDQKVTQVTKQEQTSPSIVHQTKKEEQSTKIEAPQVTKQEQTSLSIGLPFIKDVNSLLMEKKQPDQKVTQVTKQEQTSPSIGLPFIKDVNSLFVEKNKQDQKVTQSLKGKFPTEISGFNSAKDQLEIDVIRNRDNMIKRTLNNLDNKKLDNNVNNVNDYKPKFVPNKTSSKDSNDSVRSNDQIEIDVIRNSNNMFKKTLNNLDTIKLDNSKNKVNYYKPEFEPNKRLEKVRRPNGYDFVNKDNIEPNIRTKSENNAGYNHIKPGMNLFNSYGYSYMPPEVWSVPQDRPPVCIPQKGFESEALPIYTTGTPLDALEIQQSILPKFKYEQVYDPKYYYPGWKTK